MPLRIKLLLLLLSIALPPLVVVTWLDQGATRQLGLELTARARTVLAERSTEYLVTSVRAAAAAMRLERELVELAVQLQARAVERALAGAAPAAADGEVSVAGKVPAALGAKLAALGPVLARLHAEHAEAALHHRVALVDPPVEAVWPVDGHKPALGPLPWVEAVRHGARFAWSSAEPGTLRVSAPLYNGAGRFAGAVAIDLPAAWLRASAERRLPAGGRLLTLDLTAEALPISDDDERAALLAEMAKGGAGARRMDADGEDSLWAWSAAGDGAETLLYILPYSAVVAEAERAEAFVAERIGRQRLTAWAFLVMFAPAVVALALVASRHVTRPVRRLAEVARRLSEGDFTVRANVRSGDEIEELGRAFDAMVPQLDERLRLRESLDLAQEVQRNLLPAAAPAVAGFDVAGRSVYCDETGGDYYDFFVPPGAGPDRLAVVVGDVAGHGVAAALSMTAARALLRSRPAEPGRLAELAAGVNHDLADHLHGGRFMTVFLAVLAAESRSMHWVSAGHGPAIAYDPEQDRFDEIGGLDIPLGVDPDWRFHELSHTGWPTGAVLVIGTDGMWEARDPDGAMYGQDRLCRVVRATCRRPAAEIVEAVTADLAAFRRGRALHDDATLVVVKAL
ncbi:MAG: PP2C family protein-serine/threonine phosphatase [Actinomycetota bacterium]